MSGGTRKYIECTRCILDSNDDPNLVLDSEGICNHCRNYEAQAKLYLKTGTEAEQLMDSTIKKDKGLWQE